MPWAGAPTTWPQGAVIMFKEGCVWLGGVLLPGRLMWTRLSAVSLWSRWPDSFLLPLCLLCTMWTPVTIIYNTQV